MPLKIELKPNERIIVGDALITNDNERVRFYIEGNVPILREKFILREKDANTPCKRLYYVVQQMYLCKNNKDFQKLYLDYARDLQLSSKSLIPYVMPVSVALLDGNYYAAIKLADKLVKKEDELFGDALRGAIKE